MLPAFNRDVTGALRVLEGVFVALCLATLPAGAMSQFRADLFGRQLSSILITWPVHLSWAFMIKTSALTHTHTSISWLVTLSSQEMTRSLRRQRRWNRSIFLGCLR